MTYDYVVCVHESLTIVQRESPREVLDVVPRFLLLYFTTYGDATNSRNYEET